MTKTRHSLLTTRELSTIAILAAIAAVLFMIEIPVVLFYKLDLSSLPVLLGAFAMGPVPGTLILLVKALLGLLHTTSQGVGELADFIMGFAMMFPAAIIYRRMKSRKGAIIGMVAGTIIATVVAVLTNLFIMIPFYGAAYGMPVEAIVGMGQALVPAVDTTGKFVLLITAPFNVLKWVVISVVTALVYKPLSPILHGRKKSGTEAKKL
ncbi:MAG: ECF transporter S component [Clostridia bacterium]|nr:ECF transporter S component [Clostridia bacterium]